MCMVAQVTTLPLGSRRLPAVLDTSLCPETGLRLAPVVAMGDHEELQHNISCRQGGTRFEPSLALTFTLYLTRILRTLPDSRVQRGWFGG